MSVELVIHCDCSSDKSERDCRCTAYQVNEGLLEGALAEVKAEGWTWSAAGERCPECVSGVHVAPRVAAE